MPTVEAADVDVEGNGGGGGAGNPHYRRRRRRRRRRRPSMAASSETTTDGSFRFSDSDSDQSWVSAAGGPYEECRCSAATERLRGSRRKSCSVSGALSDDEIDLESGELELKVHNDERDCRICHLSLSGSGGIDGGGGDGELEPSGGGAIELGCSCRGDLGTAHKHCAETWFKIKGNTTCEICGATAVNIAGEQATTEEIDTSGVASAAPVVVSENQNFWRGRRVMNFLLACMVFAFVISWLFHFNILP
ncbi:uncharacterized protein LOC116015117 [Ipomoea triloba]|uniref:uncharacterized protein LOC116015117 n=1 Tax=Ipomoea triloba TaxID=35885 RepID=UPI00125D90B1|nr:uncharacterized protein LOC116015117 [Ipomoea triloba]